MRPGVTRHVPPQEHHPKTVHDGNYCTPYYARNRERILAVARAKRQALPKVQRPVKTPEERAAAKKARQQRELAAHQERYRTDPVYREQTKLKARAAYKAREEAKGRTLRVPMTPDQRKAKRKARDKAKQERLAASRPKRVLLTPEERWLRKDLARRRERAAAKVEAEYTILTFEGLSEAARPAFAEDMLYRAQMCQICRRAIWNARVDDWLAKYTDW